MVTPLSTLPTSPNLPTTSAMRPVLAFIRRAQSKWFTRMNTPDPGTFSQGSPKPSTEEHEGELLRLAAVELYAMRRRRDKYIARDLLGEPGWDMMLAIYAHRLDMTTSTELCHSSISPPSTGLRWVQALTNRGLIEHVHAPENPDQRLKFFALTQEGRATIERALRAMLRD